MRYEKLLMKDKQPKHTAMLFQCISIMAFTSFLLLCCRQDSMEILQTVGQINIINKTGEEIVIQTNINENPLLPGLAYSLKANGTYWQTIAESNPLPGDLDDIPWEAWDDDIANAWAKIYTYNEQGDRVLIKTWTYAQRDQAGRQLFNKEKLKIQKDYHESTKIIEYQFTLLPEDVE